jgi:Xaa-Pro aminopeptidase
MLKSWKKPTGKLPLAVRNEVGFRQRREALSKKFPGDLILIPSGHLKVRSNDTHYSFRANSDFFYLTSNLEPDCVLVLTPSADQKSHRSILFVEPNPGKTDVTFFTDRVKGELWEGARLGVPESQAKFKVDEARSLTELEEFIKSSLKNSQKPRVLRKVSDVVDQWVPVVSDEQKKRDFELAEVLSEMRLIKDKQEIVEISRAVQSTKLAFEDVIKRLKTAQTERELEGVFYTRARMEGNDVGYASIVASGEHACTLHWKKNDGKIKKGDLLLLDAGVEGTSLYTADVTRTLPINGKFSREQKLIYELVLAAQKAAFKAVKPGNDFMDPNREAMKVLAFGLSELGILGMSAEEALKEENQFYRRYSLHNVSHMLGLDVHDCAQARAETYKFGKLEAGMVLTVEPGLYFQMDDLTVPQKFRGIGVRIEDDVVVTKTGYRNLSANIPSEPKAIEAWMKSLWKKS